MRDIINKHKRVDQDAMPVEARGTLAQLANYDAKHVAIHNDKWAGFNKTMSSYKTHRMCRAGFNQVPGWKAPRFRDLATP